MLHLVKVIKTIVFQDSLKAPRRARPNATMKLIRIVEGIRLQTMPPEGYMDMPLSKTAQIIRESVSLSMAPLGSYHW